MPIRSSPLEPYPWVKMTSDLAGPPDAGGRRGPSIWAISVILPAWASSGRPSSTTLDRSWRRSATIGRRQEDRDVQDGSQSRRSQPDRLCNDLPRSLEGLSVGPYGGEGWQEDLRLLRRRRL